MRRSEAPQRVLPDSAAERALLARSIAEVAKGPEPLRVLEAGCGQKWPVVVDGVTLHITGVDTDAEAMRLRRELYGDLDVEIVGDLRTVALPPASFDIVYCSFVLEHVDGAAHVLERLVEATRPGGRLIIRVPDGDSVYGFFAKHSPFKVHVLYKRYVEGFTDAGKPGHAPYPTVYDEVVSVHGMRAFAHQHRLTVVEDYGSSTYLNIFGRWRGLAQRALSAVAFLSRRRLTASHNNVGFILERPAAGS